MLVILILEDKTFKNFYLTMNNDWRCKVTPQTILTVKSNLNSQICYRNKIEIVYSRNMKIFSQTKLGVLNPNPWSQVRVKKILKITKTRPLVKKVYRAATLASRNDSMATTTTAYYTSLCSLRWRIVSCCCCSHVVAML